jgi:Zn-dependent peptidase ImmA (M78 family)/transcriptional regulator with XRE-family HTH domain
MINGYRILQVRHLLKINQKELAAKVGIHPAELLKLESDLHDVTEGRKQLVAKIAIATGFPVGFFMRSMPQEVPLGSMLFRCRSGLSKTDKMSLKEAVLIQLEVMRGLATGTKPIALHFPRFSPMPASEAAAITRSTLGLSPERPVPHLIHLLESNGVIVLSLTGTEPEFDGFSFWSSGDERKPVLVVASDRPGDRTRMTCAHEMGHLILHKELSGDLQELEKQAYEFAAEFLMPEEGIIGDLDGCVALFQFAKLKVKWHVSMQALIRRAYDLKTISKKDYEALFTELSMKGWRKREPENLDIPVEKPRLMMKLAELKTGIPVNLEKVGGLADISPSLAEQYLKGYTSYRELQTKVVESDSEQSSEIAPAMGAGNNVISFGKRVG